MRKRIGNIKTWIYKQLLKYCGTVTWKERVYEPNVFKAPQEWDYTHRYVRKLNILGERLLNKINRDIDTTTTYVLEAHSSMIRESNENRL